MARLLLLLFIIIIWGVGASYIGKTKPQSPFEANLVRPPGSTVLDYDVAKDRTRLLLNTTASGSVSAELNLVVDWDARLR